MAEKIQSKETSISEKLVRDLACDMEEANRNVRSAYSECPSYETITKALLDHGVDNIVQHCSFTPGIPVKAMLAKPMTSVQQVLAKFENKTFTCEYKYDGERAQIHILRRKPKQTAQPNIITDQTELKADQLAQQSGKTEMAAEEGGKENVQADLLPTGGASVGAGGSQNMEVGERVHQVEKAVSVQQEKQGWGAGEDAMEVEGQGGQQKSVQARVVEGPQEGKNGQGVEQTEVGGEKQKQASEARKKFEFLSKKGQKDKDSKEGKKRSGKEVMQVKLQEGEFDVRIYSRNSENNTGKFPDLVSYLPTRVNDDVDSAVLDAEVVAYDFEKKQIRPFQVLSTRARKAVKEEDITVQVCVYAFDLLYYNGKPLLQRPLDERREYLYKVFMEETGRLELAKAITETDVNNLQEFLDDAVLHGTEGLIVKDLQSTYEPSKRSNNWLKLKKDYLDEGGDSLDLVPIGAWYGKGKRSMVYGSFLLACYNYDNDSDQGRLEALTRIGTGFSDELLAQLLQQLKQLKEKPEEYVVYEGKEDTHPDVWFECDREKGGQVWEVKAADFSLSPKYCAASDFVEGAGGISVRFPRLLRVRDDKTFRDATTSEQVAEMYRNQPQFNYEEEVQSD